MSDQIKGVLAYAYRRGHLEGQADMAKVIREKIRNNKDSNPYCLLIDIESELLTLIEEVNTNVAKMRNQDNYE
jgi:hypothetical protein